MTAWNGTPDEPEKLPDTPQGDLPRWPGLKNVTALSASEIERCEWKAVLDTLRQAQAALPGRQTWLDGAIGIADQRARIARRTDADLQATGAAGALAMREAFAQHLKQRADELAGVVERREKAGQPCLVPGVKLMEIVQMRAALAALPLPNPDALAAAVAEAVGKEREACIEAAREALVSFHSLHSRDARGAWNPSSIFDVVNSAIRTRPTGGGSGT